LYKAPLDVGVDGFWNDMNEPGVFAPDGFDKPEISLSPQKTFPLDAQHAGDGQPGTHAQYHNVYGMQMARASFEGLRSLRPDKRPLVLTRAGFAGVQRYAAVWTGDNSPTWTHLALTIPMLTNLSVSGVPFVGADVGGFMGSPSAELHTRWLQAAALTPYFRTHSNDVSAPREPWAFGAAHERINRATIELRYRLLPYLYTLFADNEQSGLPPLRPLWFAYPGDVRASRAAGPAAAVHPRRRRRAHGTRRAAHGRVEGRPADARRRGGRRRRPRVPGRGRRLRLSRRHGAHDRRDGGRTRRAAGHPD
jgi:alpha-glucosidase